jgi:hypothetical protein
MTHERWSVDLHAHTTYSDGSQSPGALVRLAKAQGVRVLAVTDHDHTGGVDEALVAGANAGVEIIPGIELSVSHAEFEDIHILAYYCAWQAPPLLERLTACRIARESRAERILEGINARLSATGHQPIAYGEVTARVQGAVGRPHIATLLVEHGYVSDMNAAFRDYLIPCNVPKYFMSASDALHLIHQVRGLSSAAHPKYITPEHRRLREVIGELQALGLDGIEAYHGDHNADERQLSLRLANQLGLMVTGGSDYHGFKPQGGHHDGGSKLGSQHLPYGMAVQLRRAYLTRYPLALLLLQWPAAAAASLRRALHAAYRLIAGETVQGPALKHDAADHRYPTASLVLQVQSADAAWLDALTMGGEEQDRRNVVIPWETTSPETYGRHHSTGIVTGARFQRTPVTRLAHELVHEAILAQLR